VLIHGVCEPVKLYVNGRRSIRSALYFALNLLPKILKERFDVIDCQAFPYFPCFPAKLSSVLHSSSLVITWHEVWQDYWIEYLGYKGMFGKIVEKIVLKISKNNIAVSKRTKDELEKYGVKAVLIPNGIDFRLISRIKPSDDRYDIVFVGRLIKEKNVDLLIKAVARIKCNMPDVRCLIIGKGPEGERLKKMAKSLNVEDNIIFKEGASYDSVISHMKSSKVFVLPSTREGFGIVVLEANACGLPVVTLNHERNFACDLIQNGLNGYTCNNSESDMAEKILLCLESKVKCVCKKIAAKYDWDAIVKKLDIFYKNLL